MVKKKGLAAFKKKKNSRIVTEGLKQNEPPLQDLVEFIIPGFAGYAGTRLVSRVVHSIVLNRMPRFAKHAGVLSAFATAGAAWLAVHRIEKIKEYHTPVVVGSSIAALQSVVQTYLPKYGWIVSDHEGTSQAALPAAPATASASASAGWLPVSAPITDSAASVDDFEEDLGSLGDMGDGLGLSDSDIDELLITN